MKYIPGPDTALTRSALGVILIAALAYAEIRLQFEFLSLLR